MFGLSSLFLVWLTRSGARKLPRESAAQLSKGWMLTYQTGALIAALLLFADAVAVLSPAGPALYLVGLGWAGTCSWLPRYLSDC